MQMIYFLFHTGNQNCAAWKHYGLRRKSLELGVQLRLQGLGIDLKQQRSTVFRGVGPCLSKREKVAGRTCRAVWGKVRPLRPCLGQSDPAVPMSSAVTTMSS